MKLDNSYNLCIGHKKLLNKYAQYNNFNKK